MKRSHLIQIILNSSILNHWHWFRPHFVPLRGGKETPLASSLLDTLLNISDILPSMSAHFLTRIAGLSGRVRNPRQYEQLMQVLAEIMVIHRAIMYPWREAVKFVPEPQGNNSKKSPEIHLHFPNHTLGIEVKSPSFLPHENPNALKNQPQVSHTFNPVESYLISASEKFSYMKEKHEEYISILYIVWDEQIQSPLNLLQNSKSSIFQCSHKSFPRIDAVIISQHRTHFEALVNNTTSPFYLYHLLDYGVSGEPPYKFIIINPLSSKKIPLEIKRCFQTISPD